MLLSSTCKILFAQDDYAKSTKIFSLEDVQSDSVVQQIVDEIKLLDEGSQLPYIPILKNVSFDDVNFQLKVWNAIATQVKDIDALDEQIYDIMTDGMMKKFKSENSILHLEDLVQLVDEVTAIKEFSQIESRYQTLYAAIADYWLQNIVSSLKEIEANDKSQSRTFDFLYIQKVCEKYQYFSTVQLETSEKVIDHFSQNKFHYLWDRFLLRTNFWQKSIVFIFLLSYVSLMVYTFYHLFKSKKS